MSLFASLATKSSKSYSLQFMKHGSGKQRGFSLLSNNLQQETKCPYHEKLVEKEKQGICLPFDEMPGPKGWPILGNTIELAQNSSNPVEYYCKLVETYGNLVKLKVMNEKMVIVADPEIAFELARQEEGRPTLNASRNYKIERNMMKIPIETTLDENWNEIRQVFNVAMKPEHIRDVIIPQLTELNSEFLKLLLKNLKQDQDIFYLENPLKDVASVYAFGSVLKIFFGNRMNEENLSKLGFTVQEFIQDSVGITDLNLKLQYQPPIYKFYKTKDYKTLEYLLDTSYARTNRIIEIFSNGYNGEIPRFFELVNERSRGMPSETTASCLSAFLMAGVDVTARMINSMFYRIAHEKDCVQRMFEETVQVFGEPTLEELTSENGLSITPDHLKQLKLCKYFVEELLRLDHVLPVRNARLLTKDTELGGFKLDKGTLLFFLDEPITQSKFVPRGLEFIPERHEKGSELSEPKGYFGPFGKGARKCVGERVANFELYFALINIIRHFTSFHSNGDEFPPFSTEGSVFSIDCSKYKVYFKPREHLINHLRSMKTIVK